MGSPFEEEAEPGSWVPVLLDALPRAVILTDAQGTLSTWNERAARLFRLDHHSLGQPATAVLAKAGVASLGSAVEEVLRSGETRDRHVVRSLDDDPPLEVWVHVAPLRDGPRIVGVLAAAEDMSAARQLEHRYRELADHLVLALAAGELGTFRWDLATGVTTWDATTEALFGMAPGTFDGTYEAWTAMLHPEERGGVLAVLDDAVASRSSYTLDHRVTWPDGSVHWLHGRAQVTVDDEGTPTGTIGCVADITARKEAEIEAERRAVRAAADAASERLHRRRLEFVARITDEAVAADDHRAFMAAVANRAVPDLGDWCSIHFVPEPGAAPEVVVAHHDQAKVQWALDLASRYSLDPDAPRGIPAVIRDGSIEFHPHITPDLLQAVASEVSTMPEAEARAVLEALGLTSVITVPLRTKRGVLGAVQFVSAESGRVYTTDDLALAEAVAGRVGEALNAMWLMEQQRHIAATLQAALLPPKLPTIPGATLAVRYWAAGAAIEVGGDFYDAFPIAEGRWGITMGDVCGTGPDAASLTGLARHTVRAAAKHGADHSSVLEWLNLAVRESNRDLFLTAAFATLDHVDDRWKLTVACGGHPLPVVVQADGTALSVGRPGSLLGVFTDINTQATTIGLRPGDTVVFYTDGLTDVPPPHTLDPAQVEQMASDAASGHREAEAVADELGQSVEKILALRERPDDIALVVIQITQPAGGTAPG